MLLSVFQDFLKHALIYFFPVVLSKHKDIEWGRHMPWKEMLLKSIQMITQPLSDQNGRVFYHDLHAHVILLSITTFNAFRTFHWNHLLGITEIAKNKTTLRSQRRAYTLRLLVFFGLPATSTNTNKNKEDNKENQNEYRRNAQSNHHAV